MVQQGAASVTARAPGARLFLGAEAEDADLDFAQGQVSVRTFRSPGKETNNEDSAAVIPFGANGLVLAVADGVGGSPGGQQASNLAVQTLADVLARTSPEPDNLRTAIVDAVEEANRRILDRGRGAATTLVVGELLNGRVRSYHVGDSELMTVGQRGRIKLRVTPHSPTGFAVEAGLLDEDEAVEHDTRHLLFNVIGAPDMRIEIGTPARIDAYDTVILSSDGLLDNLFVDEIVRIIRSGDLARAADELTGLALARMAGSDTGPSKPDDLTIILYRLPRRRRGRRGSSSRS
ncbi:MAG: serine/threonine-protein phosphatase [Gammaproteobacteria bacterium]|nr:serine/threonine-protein phosphatase [Gammaproteobacteria bacterium]MDH3506531.1 serine/threonine-protein phosphatase [Gammaproteobacteria bacterium]